MKKSAIQKQLGLEVKVVVMVFLFLFEARAVHAASITGVGDLAGGAVESLVYDLSNDGSTAVGYSASTLSTLEAFYWTSGGGIVALGDLPGGTFFSIAYGVSGDGSVIAGEGRSASGTEAFVWTSGGGMVGLGDFAGGSFSSSAFDISGDGSTVVGRGNETGGSSRAFSWTSGGGMVALANLPSASGSSAVGTNDDGTIIVGGAFDSGAVYQPVLWDNGVIQSLGLPVGYTEGESQAVSENGLVVTGYVIDGGGEYEMFRWTSGGGLVAIGNLAGGTEAYGLALNSDGSIIVGYDLVGSDYLAFIWDSTNGMRDLNDVLVNDYGIDLTGWTLTSASSISSDGLYLAGEGVHNGNTEGWVAYLGGGGGPVPEPGTLLLLSSGLIAFFSRRFLKK